MVPKVTLNELKKAYEEAKKKIKERENGASQV